MIVMAVTITMTIPIPVRVGVAIPVIWRSDVHRRRGSHYDRRWTSCDGSRAIHHRGRRINHRRS